MKGKKRRRRPAPDVDELDHLICPLCGWDEALCGADVSGSVWAAETVPAVTCVVCLELAEQPCLNCGE